MRKFIEIPKYIMVLWLWCGHLSLSRWLRWWVPVDVLTQGIHIWIESLLPYFLLRSDACFPELMGPPLSKLRNRHSFFKKHLTNTEKVMTLGLRQFCLLWIKILHISTIFFKSINNNDYNNLLNLYALGSLPPPKNEIYNNRQKTYKGWQRWQKRKKTLTGIKRNRTHAIQIGLHSVTKGLGKRLSLHSSLKH